MFRTQWFNETLVASKVGEISRDKIGDAVNEHGRYDTSIVYLLTRNPIILDKVYPLLSHCARLFEKAGYPQKCSRIRETVRSRKTESVSRTRSGAYSNILSDHLAANAKTRYSRQAPQEVGNADMICTRRDGRIEKDVRV